MLHIKASLIVTILQTRCKEHLSLLCLKINNSLNTFIKGDIIMIYKVYYQEDKARSPQREKTVSLYIEASSPVEARKIIEEKTIYNIELIQELDGNHLEYEKEHADFKLVEFE